MAGTGTEKLRVKRQRNTPGAEKEAGNGMEWKTGTGNRDKNRSRIRTGRERKKRPGTEWSGKRGTGNGEQSQKQKQDTDRTETKNKGGKKRNGKKTGMNRKEWKGIGKGAKGWDGMEKTGTAGLNHSDAIHRKGKNSLPEPYPVVPCSLRKKSKGAGANSPTGLANRFWKLPLRPSRPGTRPGHSKGFRQIYARRTCHIT